VRERSGKRKREREREREGEREREREREIEGLKPACPKDKKPFLKLLSEKSSSEALNSVSGSFKSGKKCQKLAKFVLQTLEQMINLSPRERKGTR